LAALLHDLGKTLVPKEVLDKTDDLTDEDWGELRQHPEHAVEILLGQGQLSPGILAAVVAGFEHHVNYDLSGYPPLVNEDHRITLFGRIIAIASTLPGPWCGCRPAKWASSLARPNPPLRSIGRW
jgi:HD-GYP domain-containing protein (c-di-GMP phosphodiesterase class II)